MIHRRRLITGSAMAGFGLSLVAAAAQARVAAVGKPIRILVGFPPGGAPDTTARLLAEEMKDYAPSILVDNHPGAGGRLALEALKTADADGSVFGVSPADPLTLFPHLYKALAYDPLRDFAPVTTVCTAHFVFVVGPMVPAGVSTLADFIEWCRANPRLATFGSPAVAEGASFSSAFARSRRQSMKRWPMGLSVRCLRVTTLSGNDQRGILIGRTWMGARCAP